VSAITAIPMTPWKKNIQLELKGNDGLKIWSKKFVKKAGERNMIVS
jgi:hypothetical protein